MSDTAEGMLLDSAGYTRLCEALRDQIAEYLTGADLRCCAPQLEEAVGLPYDLIRARLRRVGLTWNDLKQAERERRLGGLVATGASRREMMGCLALSDHGFTQFLRRAGFRNYSAMMAGAA